MSPPVRLPVLALAGVVGIVVAEWSGWPWWVWAGAMMAVAASGAWSGTRPASSSTETSGAGTAATGTAATLAMRSVARSAAGRVLGRRWSAAARWIVAVVLVMAARAAGEREPGPPPAGAVADDRTADVVEGWVSGPMLPGPGGVGFVVDAEGARVWVTATGRPRVWPGDRVRVVGRLETPRGRRNPGGIDRAQVVAGRGARWSMHARELTVVRAADVMSLWRAPAQAARRASETIAARGGDGQGNALVRAAVVGDRSAVSEETDAAWRAAGVYHALSVSGLHLAVVALAAFVALTWIAAAIGPIARRVAPRRVAAAIALGLGVGYTLVTGGQVATLRALVVVAAVLAGAIVERRVRVADALGLAALGLLAWRPSVLWDPGFQLSFVAATTLVIAARRDAAAAIVVDELRGVRRIARRIGRGVARAIATSWAVTLATAPITAHHFGEVALGGVIGNLIAGPAIELAAIPLGLIGLVLGLGSPAAGGVAIDLAVAIAGLTARAVAAIAAWTPLAIVRAPTTIELAACAGLYAAWAWARLARARTGVRGGRVGAIGPGALAVVAAAALCGSWAWHAHDRAHDDALRVTFLDVGQGDAAVIELPDGGVWLIDAGGAPGAGSRAMQIAPGRAVAAFLRARGIARIDVAVVSHPHPDHYLGLLAVAAEVPIDRIWDARPPGELEDHRAGEALRSDASDPDPHRGGLSYEDVIAHLGVRGTRREHPALGAHVRGDVTIEVLAPRLVVDEAGTVVAVAAADGVRSVNDGSLVIGVVRAGKRILFTGDLEHEGEEVLVAEAAALASEVVKVPHHGSPTSSTAALVAATRPAWAVVSLGRGNRFGFPGSEVVARWEAAGATVVRTDRAGAIEVVIDRVGGVIVSTYAGETRRPGRVIMPR